MPVARGNDIALNYPDATSKSWKRWAARGFTLPVPRPWARVRFFISSCIDLDLARLLHLGAQIGQEQAEHFLLLVLDEAHRGSGLSWPRNPAAVGSCLSRIDKHHAGGAVADRTADLARLQGERHRGAARHGTDVRNLAVGQHEVAGLDGCASFFGGLLQVVLGLGAIGQFLGLLRRAGRQRARS